MGIHEVWRRLASHQRQQVSIELAALRRSDAGWPASAVHALARALSFRPKRIWTLKDDALTDLLVRHLGRMPARPLENLLVHLHIHGRPELLGAVYEALGVEHHGADVSDDRLDRPLDEQVALSGVRSLLETGRVDPHQVALCLEVMSGATTPTWQPVIDRVRDLARAHLDPARRSLPGETGPAIAETVAESATLLTTPATDALEIADLQFDPLLQPDDLSRLALGVVANMSGQVSGTGRLDWGANGVTSSGQLTTNDLDFAAAFGPVRGASGTIRFTDLLSLTTAPGQTLRVASINPGIEVLDGEIEFALRDWQFLSVAGGRWPFMGGELILREVDLNFGVEEERRYVFEIVGLDAGAFVDQMDIGNLSATGTFDGTVPIVFDAQGNGRIEGGLLLSRAPGGNISYVGELTYEDLSPIANFAFDALRSLDYRQMRLAMDGPLTGEIVTRVRFDGVSQGEGASSNFITRRLSALPLQFRVNIRAPFYQLITSLKSLYDPAAVRDPRSLGLLSADGGRLLRREITGEEAQERIEEEDIVPDGADEGS